MPLENIFILFSFSYLLARYLSRCVSRFSPQRCFRYHLCSFEELLNAVIVSKQNVVGIIFLNVQKCFGVRVFAESWLTCGSRQGGASASRISLACALDDRSAVESLKMPVVKSMLFSLKVLIQKKNESTNTNWKKCHTF